MNRLSQEQQQLILDFYFRCGEQDDIEQGRDLIASNPVAAQLYAGLEETLTELDNVKYEPCPDNLVDLTIARLKLASMAGQSAPSADLNELLKQQQDYSATAPAWASRSRFELLRTHYVRPLFETLSAAAAILIVAGMLFPSLGLMRQHSRQMACNRNLGQVGAAMAGFFADNSKASELSNMEIKDGDPWWKIGYDGPETQSNTRYVWNLVKQGYVPAEAFICKGRSCDTPVQVSPQQLAALQDFPSRRHISYSFILLNGKSFNPAQSPRKVVAGDLNPVFEKIPCQQNIYQKLNEFEKVLLNEQLRQTMSGSHGCRGQNILYSDGSVTFIRTRVVDGDDIFTVSGVDTYTGCEIPSDARDVFLAP
jgi:hypothetical protein